MKVPWRGLVLAFPVCVVVVVEACLPPLLVGDCPRWLRTVVLVAHVPLVVMAVVSVLHVLLALYVNASGPPAAPGGRRPGPAAPVAPVAPVASGVAPAGDPRLAAIGLGIAASQRYLGRLEVNNSVAWVRAHQGEHVAGRAAFEGLVRQVLDVLTALDPALAVADHGRLVLPLRREPGTGTYRVVLRAHLSRGLARAVPVGFRLSLTPAEAVVAGGVWCAASPGVARLVRERIADEPDELAAILAAPAFAQGFEIHGKRLGRLPPRYDPAHPCAPLLKQRSWVARRTLGPQVLADPATFVETITAAYVTLEPFVEYLDRALTVLGVPVERAGASR